MRRLACAALLLTLAALPATAQTNSHSQIVPEGASGFTATETVVAERWMAVANHPDATAAAAAVLREGGSAVDAAIAAQAMLGLVEPQASGIGGGAFLLFWDAGTQKLHVYDGRETAPAAVDPNHFLTPDGGPMPFMEAVVGGHAVGVPGVLRMLELAHARHGKLPWPGLFKQAIGRAEAGFPVSPRLHSLLTQMPELKQRPPLRSYFFTAAGEPLPIGTVLRNSAYGDTLRRIATGGAAVFYEGEIARDIVAAVRNAPRPGKLALEDLAGYRAIEREPVCSAFHHYRVCGAPPPSAGGTTVQAILGMLTQLPAETLRAGSIDYLHRFAEASRLAFADRNTYVADPDFVAVPTAGLVDADYLRQRAALIGEERMASAGPGKPPTDDRHVYRYRQAASPERISTSQITIVDAGGNALSMTTSIEMAFGAQLMVRGFLLNNQLTDFSFTPSLPEGGAVANRIEPGKRPRSSMAPTIVFADDKPAVLTGSPGGARIIDYVARALFETLSGQHSLTASIAAGHIVDLGFGLELEAGRFDADTQNALRQRGHVVKELPQTSGLNGIVIDGGRLRGSVDPRREGTAAGE